jgi:hypothetical protein
MLQGKDSEFGFIGPENFFPLPNCPMLMFFGPLQTFALILYALQWFLDVQFCQKIGFIEATFHRRYMNGIRQALVNI